MKSEIFTNEFEQQIKFNSMRNISLSLLTLSLMACGGGGSSSNEVPDRDTEDNSAVKITVTPSAGSNGSISPDIPQLVDDGNTIRFSVTPDAGYDIESVTGCGGTLSGNQYTTAAITEACSVVASFSDEAAAVFQVTPSLTFNGALSPSTPQTVNSGATTQFTVSPNDGYVIESVTGCAGSLEGNTYTTAPITGDCTVTAKFISSVVPVNTYSVTPETFGNGSISPSSAQVVNEGDTTQFTVTPDTGYIIDSVTGCGGSLQGNRFTTATITYDCTVVASFSARPDPSTSFLVTPIESENGTISPSSPQRVEKGQRSQFTIIPDQGYTIASVLGCGGSLQGSIFTTAGIASNCTITANFEPESNFVNARISRLVSAGEPIRIDSPTTYAETATFENVLVTRDGQIVISAPIVENGITKRALLAGDLQSQKVLIAQGDRFPNLFEDMAFHWVSDYSIAGSNSIGAILTFAGPLTGQINTYVKTYAVFANDSMSIVAKPGDIIDTWEGPQVVAEVYSGSHTDAGSLVDIRLENRTQGLFLITKEGSVEQIATTTTNSIPDSATTVGNDCRYVLNAPEYRKYQMTNSGVIYFNAIPKTSNCSHAIISYKDGLYRVLTPFNESINNYTPLVRTIEMSRIVNNDELLIYKESRSNAEFSWLAKIDHLGDFDLITLGSESLPDRPTYDIGAHTKYYANGAVTSTTLNNSSNHTRSHYILYSEAREGLPYDVSDRGPTFKNPGESTLRILVEAGTLGEFYTSGEPYFDNFSSPVIGSPNNVYFYANVNQFSFGDSDSAFDDTLLTERSLFLAGPDKEPKVISSEKDLIIANNGVISVGLESPRIMYITDDDKIVVAPDGSSGKPNSLLLIDGAENF